MSEQFTPAELAAIKRYKTEFARKGGKASRRVLTPEQARAMVQAREAKRLKKK